MLFRSGQSGNYSGEESAWRGKVIGYNDGHPVTCDVEQSGANPWGLFGVGGNVWEGCAADTSPEAPFAAWRGGCWGASTQEFIRCEGQFSQNAAARSGFIGFRLVLAPGPMRRLPAWPGRPGTKDGGRQ